MAIYLTELNGFLQSMVTWVFYNANLKPNLKILHTKLLGFLISLFESDVFGLFGHLIFSSM